MEHKELEQARMKASEDALDVAEECILEAGRRLGWQSAGLESRAEGRLLSFLVGKGKDDERAVVFLHLHVPSWQPDQDVVEQVVLGVWYLTVGTRINYRQSNETIIRNVTPFLREQAARSLKQHERHLVSIQAQAALDQVNDLIREEYGAKWLGYTGLAIDTTNSRKDAARFTMNLQNLDGELVQYLVAMLAARME